MHLSKEPQELTLQKTELYDPWASTGHFTYLSKTAVSNTIATSHMWLLVIYFVAIRKLKISHFQKNILVIMY